MTPPTAADYQARRVVVGTTDVGRSTIVEDGPATTRAVLPICTVVDLWSVPSLPAVVEDPDSLDGNVALDPPPAGALVRMVTLPPDAEWKTSGGGFGESLSAMGGADAAADDHDDSSGMHATDTVDVIVVVSGEVYAVLEDGETLLRPGDSLIQRGTKHAWSNRTDQPVTFVATMISAKS
ncbi:cupin domain-containing protein [Pseudonocardia sp. C8]|uniref:cupin domain-containing protein n=1 Tax=Pseudonocardia sp. C8 TaxID=2762759 RepID=UPI0016424CF1|nr:cupin domain-containing protein [Pseudonocardia sp. C8]MBC3191848.1 cupin domain-containing protein [Pseudonocardia sp. C8]